ncbi:hypothetical protein CROQUDRAFT_131741 [Cronartium quercuum f. sp. fusiforme G11]|uniref:BZIP domain-containing protein n=1 Tax=Cronartium quercuum f. sp. fusiforme G11 TaxID=708437 RepID=A0A9P6NR08_9BASI|nr:hypothetical protein CROQUDRAFT_131741 [Cronartium quercuum f. sp. fusiforme G11]
MAENWPFLHLNLLSPDLSPKDLPLNGSNGQDNSLNSIELNRQLEAWTNIDFNFDIEPASDAQPTSSSLTYPSGESAAGNGGSLDQLFGFPPAHKTYHHQPSSSPAFVVPANSSAFQHVHDLSQSSSQLNHNSQPAPTLLSTAPLSFSDAGTKGLEANISVDSKITSQGLSGSSPTGQSNGSHSTKVDQLILDDDEANRIAIEDDKRRRNTLASARFRMKKKMKEQEIERTAREMKERVTDLEKEVESLKQENKWLRGLIVEQAATKAAISAGHEIDIPVLVPAPVVSTKRSITEEEPQPILVTRSKPGRKPNASNKKAKSDK